MKLCVMLAKQLGPWPPPDITLFSAMLEQDQTCASDLASLFLHPGYFLVKIRGLEILLQ